MNGGRASYQTGTVAVVVLDSTATPVVRAGLSLFPPQVLAVAERAVLVQWADLPRPAAGELPARSTTFRRTHGEDHRWNPVPNLVGSLPLPIWTNLGRLTHADTRPTSIVMPLHESDAEAPSPPRVRSWQPLEALRTGLNSGCAAHPHRVSNDPRARDTCAPRALSDRGTSNQLSGYRKTGQNGGPAARFGVTGG